MEIINHPTQSSFNPVFIPKQKYYDCIESCFECASSSWICADACLHEVDHEQLSNTITLCLSTAEICAATARALIVQGDFINDMTVAQLKNCIEICYSCKDECLKHSDLHEHCQICAQCCQECINMCKKYVQIMEAKEA